MARLYGLIFIIALIVVIVVGIYVGKSIHDRRRRLQKARDAREEQLRDVVQRQMVQDAEDGWKAQKRHRERLERDLDDYHQRGRGD